MIFDSQRMKAFLKKIGSNEKGAALIASLLVLMVLVLLGLTLILQSQTEYLGAVNENDSLAALSFAESGLEWAERAIKDEATGMPDLDVVLQGIDDVVNTVPPIDDGIIGIRNLSTTLTFLNQLNSTCPGSTCEQTESIKFSYDWDQDGTPELFEAFRTGTDVDGDLIWDGPRTHLFVRIEDNYDDPLNSGDRDFDDEDWVARVRVMSEYPIFVDSAGVAQDPVLATRGIAIRRLEGRLSPAQSVAIRTNKEFEGDGTMKICGSCGGVHSNGNMHFNGSSGQVCGDATASGDYSFTGGGPTVGGTSGGNQPEQPIPPINPYDDMWVPAIGTFDHSADAELNFLPPSVLGNALQCGPPTALDPGNSKYFALVFKQQNGQNLQIYKAYWDHTGTAGGRWTWRLIDATPTLNAVLDNCGRLVSSEFAAGPDPCPITAIGCDGSGFATYGVSDLVDCCGSAWPPADGGDGNTYCDPNCMDPGPDGLIDTADDINRCRPDGSISACDGTTSGDEQFYGFKGSASYVSDTCGSDDSLTGTADNDFTQNNFFLYPSGNNSDAAVPALPGSGGPDGSPDFVYSVVTQKNRQVWSNNTTTIFAPMYNAFIFTVGNLNFNGNMQNGFLQFFDHDPVSPNLPATYSIPNPMGRWRVSAISYGRIEGRGTPRLAPANSNTGACGPNVSQFACHLGMIAGRDLDLAGSAGSGCDVEPAPGECNLCPDLNADPNASCDFSPSVPFGYEGYFFAHEQVNLSGNANFAGIVMAEEAAYCVETQNPGLKTRMNGNPDIYYDCNSPPDPFLAELLRITSWEEVQ